MVNEGLKGFPIKNVIILVVTVTVRGPHPRYSQCQLVQDFFHQPYFTPFYNFLFGPILPGHLPILVPRVLTLQPPVGVA